jgi:hypothetical protein
MKTPFADAEIPLSEIPKARARRNEFIAECRRYQIAVSDPNRKRQAPWKIRDQAKPLPPAWAFERDKQGKITLAKQLRRMPNTMDHDQRFSNRKFIAVIEGDPCVIGGEHVENGCRVEAYAEAALGIHGTRGRIIEEFSE